METIKLKRIKDRWGQWEVAEESLSEVENAIKPCPFCGEKISVWYESPCNGNGLKYVWRVNHFCEEGELTIEGIYEGEFAHTQLIEDLNRR